MKKLIIIMLFITVTVSSLFAREVLIEQKIAGLYVAFFNRAPDKAGLDYWKNRADIAQTNGAGASSVFKELSAGFASHPVFTSTYSSLDNEAFVKAIYVNTLGREGDEEGIAFWRDNLNNGLSRSDMVASFVELSLILDLTPQNFPSLSTAELDAAKLRQDLITNKTLVAINFVNELGDKTNVADSQNPENDPAYLASIRIISKVNEESDSVSETLAYLGNILESSDPIEKILNEWGENTLEPSNTIISLFSSLNGYNLGNTLVPGSEATIILSDFPHDNALKVHVDTSSGVKEITPAFVSDSNITFVAPLDTIKGNLYVSGANFSTFAISYITMLLQSPFIESIEPEIAHIGDSVTISGKNLSSLSGILHFEGQDDNFSQAVTAINSKIVFTIPQGLASGAFYLEFDKSKTNTLYLSVKRSVGTHVTLADGVDINASDITFTQGLKDYSLSESYDAAVDVENIDMQYIHAFAKYNGDSFTLLYSAVVLSDMSTVNVDAKSTAIAWIFIGTGASNTMSSQDLKQLYTFLDSNEKVQILANTIALLQKDDFNAWVNLSDSNLKNVFQDALEEVIQNYQVFNPVKNIQSRSISTNEVVITQDPQNSNIYVNDDKYTLEISTGKLNNGTVNIINDTKLFLSIEARDKETDAIINNYQHSDPFGSSSILGPKGWPLFGISSLKNLKLDGQDAHIEIVVGAKHGNTDKQKLSTLLMTRVWLEGVATPALNIVLSTIINKKIEKRYGDKYPISRRIMIALSDIYGANFEIQFSERILGGKSSWSTLSEDFILNPIKNGLIECYEHGISSTKCEQTAKGIAELIGLGNTENIVNKIMIMTYTAGEKYILKKSVALVPVIGWITSASFFVYDNISVLSDVAIIVESLKDMEDNPKEINAYVDFPLKVSSVLPLCVAQTVEKTTQIFEIGGQGFAPLDGKNPNVYIGALSNQVDATSISVPTTETDLIADFSLDTLLTNGSREDYIFVENMGYSVMYSKPVRIVSPLDSTIYLDTITPNRAVPGATITLKGCGWIPLSDIEVTFLDVNGQAVSATIVSKDIDEIKVMVPANAVTGLMHVKTKSKDESEFFYVDDFSLTDSTQSNLEDGKPFPLNGVGLATVAHVYLIDHENNKFEGNIGNVTDTGIWIDELPSELAIGTVRTYVVLENGTKSNEITLIKIPKPPYAEPGGITWFENNISITLSQKNGNEIYYKIDDLNSSEKLYTGALTFNVDNMQNLSFTLYIFSRVTINGINYDSEVIENTYNTCDQGETIAYHEDGSGYCKVDGICPLQYNESFDKQHNWFSYKMNESDSNNDGWLDTFVLCEYDYMNTKGLLKETHYSNFTKDGIQIIYDSPGKHIYIITHYINDLKDGIEQEFNSLNELERTSIYKNDLKEGIETLYSYGNSYAFIPYKSDLIDGVAQYYYDNGILKLESSYVNGEKSGIENEYNDLGELIRETSYLNGLKDGIQIYYYTINNIKTKVETPYTNDLENGVARTYWYLDTQWILMYEVPYVNGKRDGIEKLYSQTLKHILMKEIPWNNDKKNGVEITYNMFGGINSKVPYVNGKKEGTAYYYDSDGILSQTIIYKDGCVIESYDGDGDKLQNPPYCDYEGV